MSIPALSIDIRESRRLRLLKGGIAYTQTNGLKDRRFAGLGDQNRQSPGDASENDTVDLCGAAE